MGLSDPPPNFRSSTQSPFPPPETRTTTQSTSTLNHWCLPLLRVIAGEYPGHPEKTVARAKLTELLALGVTTIIDLTEPSEGLRDYDALLRALPGGRFVHHLRCPIPDQDIADPATIHRILDHLDVALADAGVVYLHCWGGIGRTGMIAGCALVRHGMPPSGALWATEHGWQTTAKSKHPRHEGRTSPETVEQMRVVAGWESHEIARAAARGETRLRVIHMDAPPLPEALRPVRHDPREAEKRDRARGCLLGGAIGDALGWPVEFKSLEQIQQIYGPSGITELVVDARTGVAEITDDTQMTLFTAEGLLRGICRGDHRGIGGPESTMRQAYLRWLITQEGTSGFDFETLKFVLGEWRAMHGVFTTKAPTPAALERDESGWLIRERALHARRAPGNTCLSALHVLRSKFDVVQAQNDSKGCGGVMRVAPIGLIHSAAMETVFDLAVYAAQLTHGHPTGYLSAGFFAAVIRGLCDGMTVREAIEPAQAFLRRWPGDWFETDESISQATRLAKGRKKSSPELVASLGQGWVAEEALAISLFCALRCEESDAFADAIRVAVNHSGDSDSTGSMIGQLLGARFGAGVIPEAWVQQVELRDVITTVADDLVTEFDDRREWWGRYPGY